MAHSKVRLWVHAIFATKYREAQIFPTIEPHLHRMLFEQLVATGCYVDCMNGIPDHIHILFLLNPKRSLAEELDRLERLHGLSPDDEPPLPPDPDSQA